MSILSEIERLEHKSDDGLKWSDEALEYITSLKEVAIKIEAVEEVGKMNGIVLVIEDFKARIDYINKSLLMDDELLSDKGRQLKNKREWLQDFIDIFSNNLKNKISLENTIKKELL